MKKTQFTESQIIAMLKQHEQGVKVQDIARTNGISEKTVVGYIILKKVKWIACKDMPGEKTFAFLLTLRHFGILTGN